MQASYNFLKMRFYLLQGTLEMKNEKIIRLLLEMLELDASEYVRLMVSLVVYLGVWKYIHVVEGYLCS